MPSAGDKPVIRLPQTLHSSIESRVAHTEFDSVEEYAVFLLEEVVAELEDHDPDTATTDDIEDRLRALGYVDT